MPAPGPQVLRRAGLSVHSNLDLDIEVPDADRAARHWSFPRRPHPQKHGCFSFLLRQPTKSRCPEQIDTCRCLSIDMDGQWSKLLYYKCFLSSKLPCNMDNEKTGKPFSTCSCLRRFRTFSRMSHRGPCFSRFRACMFLLFRAHAPASWWKVHGWRPSAKKMDVSVRWQAETFISCMARCACLKKNLILKKMLFTLSLSQ